MAKGNNTRKYIEKVFADDCRARKADMQIVAAIQLNKFQDIMDFSKLFRYNIS